MKMKFSIIFLVLILAFSNLSATALAEKGKLEDVSPQKHLDDVFTIIEENVEVNNEGIKLKDKEKTIDKIKKEQIEAINQIAKEQGLVVEYTKKSFVEVFEERIKELDEKIKKGELKVLSNGEIIEANDDNLYLQGGSTFNTYHWWGVRAYRSTSDAAYLSYMGKQYALGLVTVGAFAGVFSLGAGLGIGAVGSTYVFAFTNSIDYHNSRTNRGIVIDMTWALIYDVYAQ
jgi:anti-sigma28 factor (negative regulator of flagellin synthesis)